MKPKILLSVLMFVMITLSSLLSSCDGEKDKSTHKIYKTKTEALQAARALSRTKHGFLKPEVVEVRNNLSPEEYQKGLNLLDAIENQNIKKVEDLLDDVDANFTDNENRFPMLVNARNFNMKIAKLLIENGADLTMRRAQDGATLLHLAFRKPDRYAMQGNPEYRNPYDLQAAYMKLLIKNKVDINSDLMGRTVLEELIANDIVRKEDRTGVLGRKQYDGVMEEMLKRDDILFQYSYDERHGTILHYAVLHGKKDLMERVLEEGSVDINAVNSNNESALQYAFYYNKDYIIPLIKAGADATIKPRSGYSVFEWAARNKKQEIIDLVLEKIDPKKINPKTIVHLIVDFKEKPPKVNHDMLDDMLDKGFDPKKIYKEGGFDFNLVAAAKDDKKAIKKILDKDPTAFNFTLSSNIATINGLFIALQINDEDLFIDAIQKSNLINEQMMVGGQATYPLHEVTKKGWKNARKELIRLGANEQLKDHAGKVSSDYL